MASLSYISGDKAIVTGSPNSRLLYVLGSISVIIGILILVAWKIRYFHNLFGKDWTGKVIKTENVEIGARWAKNTINNVNAFAITVQLDKNGKKKKFIFPTEKISPNVYAVGDNILFIKGTRYPVNLTREAEQHICPMCARDSCYGDFCPDCNLKY
jgi:hypothetical protein